MNTLHLRYITEIERTGSISQAAEALYMGQPNLSRVLHEMEQSIGFAIFERTSRGVRPTARGAAFLRHAHNMLREADQIAALNPGSQAEHRFYICLPTAVSAMDAVARYLASLPAERGIDARVQELSARQTLDELAAGTTDLGIIRYPASHEDFFTAEALARHLTLDFLWEFPYGVVLKRSHPLAQAEQLDEEDLEGLTEITQDDAVLPFYPVGGHTRVIHTQEHTLQLSLLEHLPDAYMWAASMPPELLQRYGLVFRTVRGSDRRCRDALVYDMRLAFSPVEQDFLEYLLQYLHERAFA